MADGEQKTSFSADMDHNSCQDVTLGNEFFANVKTFASKSSKEQPRHSKDMWWCIASQGVDLEGEIGLN